MLRLIDSGPGEPAANLALDEALWRAFDGTPVLRVYGWAPEALSLGRFQDAAATVAAIPLPAGAPVVRRSTGGGAIWHHTGEVTYAIVCAPGRGGVPGDVAGSYDALHGIVIAALGRLGVRAGSRGVGVASDEGPALCFRRRMPVDLLVDGRKVCGSAQRRRAGALLQQGSILLDANPLVPEAVSVAAAAGRPVPRAALVAGLADAAAVVLGGPVAAGVPTAAEQQLAARLRASRYANPRWTGLAVPA